MRGFLRFFFYLLYHPFAFSYDLVAATVSLGRWKEWVLSVLPFVEGPRVLEIGHGPGHLQRALLDRNLFAVGIDESADMGRLARHNLQRRPLLGRSSQAMQDEFHIDYAKPRLIRGLGQSLPFPDESFESLVATFPAEYIFDPATIREACRVLLPGGRFIILPGAYILGRSFMDRVMALIFRVTGETPPNLSQVVRERSKGPLSKNGFTVEFHELEIRSSMVVILVATKAESR